MTSLTPSSAPASSKLTPEKALRLAWIYYMILLAIPFPIALWLILHLGMGTPKAAPGAISSPWFLATMIYVILVVPGSFFLRENTFKTYWAGKTVHPGKYFVGMLCVWLALAFGGIFSLIGCLATHSLMPNLLPAILMLMYFTTQWPHGRAMTHSVGNTQDPQIYQEPR